MERKGVNENRFQVSTFNYTVDDQKAVAILSWSKLHEDTLADLARGGCNCSIF